MARLWQAMSVRQKVMPAQDSKEGSRLSKPVGSETSCHTSLLPPIFHADPNAHTMLASPFLCGPSLVYIRCCHRKRGGDPVVCSRYRQLAAAGKRCLGCPLIQMTCSQC